MSRTVIAPPGFTLGDGSTAASVATARWTKWRWLIGVSTIVVAAVAVLALTQTPSSNQPLSIDNHLPAGARATAEVLRDQGVTVREVSTLADAHLALSGGGTLVLAHYVFLNPLQIDSIMDYPGRVVWIAPPSNELQDINGDLSLSVAAADTMVTATCDAPAATQAESLTGVRGRIVNSGDNTATTVCFSGDGGFSGAYVVLERPGAEDAHILADPFIVNNAGLDIDGNAALAFNALGSHDNLVWYVGSPWDETELTDDQAGASYFTPVSPAWLDPLVLGLILTGFMAAIWQGRRMGRLVDEPLPVVVRASEATRGRARLYRRGGARGHALAALRAGAAVRMAARLGLPPSSSADAVVTAVASATGRDVVEVRALLYGGAPQTDDQMLDVIKKLDHMESEVAQS
jgi:hypothetical protein